MSLIQSHQPINLILNPYSISDYDTTVETTGTLHGTKGELFQRFSAIDTCTRNETG